MISRVNPVLMLMVTLLSPLGARAGSIRVDFGGTIGSVTDYVSGPGEGYGLDSLVAAGDPFSGFFTFDDQAPPAVGDSVYRFTVPPWTLHLEYGAAGLEATGNGTMEITVWSWATPGTDAPNVYLTSAFASQRMFGLDVSSWFQLYLKDISGYPLSSNRLEDVPWDPSVYTPGFRAATWALEFNLGGGTHETVTVNGFIDSLHAAPEPGVGLVCGTALAVVSLALGFRRARS